jgi:predicted  nucleic acid-binding Zn-ribbon protein
MDDIGGDTTRIGLMYELLGARDGESLEEAAARVMRELDDARDTIVDQLVSMADLRAKVERLTRDLDEATRERDRLSVRLGGNGYAGVMEEPLRELVHVLRDGEEDE